MTNTISTQQQIPLNKLDVAPENARKTNVTARQEELKASIKAYGLLQPLLIRPSNKKGRFFVVDGQRRLLALKALAKEKSLKSAFPVKCEPIDPDIAHELSVTANVQAQAMHPADQFEAFYAMSENKTSIGDIAARFGVSERIVRQRLKLAKVSPKLLTLYREGEMSLEHLEAFTLTDDHEKQESLWSNLTQWQKTPHKIKSILTEQKINATDHRVKFITLEAYQKAGGHLEHDLFSEDVFLTNPSLVEDLIKQKVEEKANVLQKDGWSFVETSTSYDYEIVNQYDRIYPETVELDQKDVQRQQAIESEIEQLRSIYHDADNQNELNKKWDDLSEEYDQIEEKKTAFSKKQKAESGVYLTYRHGEFFILHGLTEKVEATPESKKEKKPKKEISERLLERLTAHKTIALQDKLSKSPEIAFDLLLTEMVRATFSQHMNTHYSCFHFHLDEPRLPQKDERLTESFGAANRQKAFDKWIDIIQPESGDLYQTTSDLKPDQKMQLLAFCFAGTFDAVHHPKAYMAKSKQDMIREICELLDLDMSEYWKPSACKYFNHVSKDIIIKSVQEAKGQENVDALKKLKKGELALRAEKLLKNSGWLPEPLRREITVQEPS